MPTRVFLPGLKKIFDEWTRRAAVESQLFNDFMRGIFRISFVKACISKNTVQSLYKKISIEMKNQSSYQMKTFARLKPEAVDP
jgi:hypothetical protein